MWVVSTLENHSFFREVVVPHPCRYPGSGDGAVNTDGAVGVPVRTAGSGNRWSLGVPSIHELLLLLFYFIASLGLHLLYGPLCLCLAAGRNQSPC